MPQNQQLEPVQWLKANENGGQNCSTFLQQTWFFFFFKLNLFIQGQMRKDTREALSETLLSALAFLKMKHFCWQPLQKLVVSNTRCTWILEVFIVRDI